MARQRRHRRRSNWFRRVKKILLTPFYIFADTAATNLKNAHLERTTESIEAEAWEKRLLARNTAAAKELREEMTSDAKSVSSGSVVSHLAKMNRKAELRPTKTEKKSEATAENPAEESPE